MVCHRSGPSVAWEAVPWTLLYAEFSKRSWSMAGQHLFQHDPNAMRPRPSAAEPPYAGHLVAGLKSCIQNPLLFNCNFVFKRTWLQGILHLDEACSSASRALLDVSKTTHWCGRWTRGYLRGASAAVCCRGLTWVVACDKLSVLCIKPPAMINLTTCRKGQVCR